MNKQEEIAKLYKEQPSLIDGVEVQNNKFTNLMLKAKSTASEACDRLAYLAGIKNAPADNQYEKLDTSNIQSLIQSAKNAGYDIEVVAI